MLDNKSEMERLEWLIASLIRGNTESDKIFNQSIALAYLAYCYEESDYERTEYSNSLAFEVISDHKIREYVIYSLRDIYPKSIRELKNANKDALKYFILNLEEKSNKIRNEFSTPKSLASLVVRLLDIQECDTVMDNCCGVGSFLRAAYETQANANYIGIELNTDTKAIAEIRGKLLGENIKIVHGDTFELKDIVKSDKAFSNYPFGMQLRYMSNSHYMQNLYSDCPEISKATSADWIFNHKLVHSIKKGGMAIGITTFGSLWNTIDKQIRKSFIVNGYIKAVVSLPPKLFASTSIPVALIIFGDSKDHIRFVDASSICESGRRQNILSCENIESIIYAINNDTDISKIVSFEEIASNDFVLSPNRYIMEKKEVKNGVEFSSVIKNITRGAPLTASELDNLISQKPTKDQYIMLANIKDGIVDEELPYLTEIEEKNFKYCAKNKSLLLSKNGIPFKVAVAEVSEGKRLLANGNLYIIELDETKVNPYYLKAFFESETGILALKSITVGATIPNIGISQLNKLIIPLLSMEKQDIIAEKYVAVIKQIALYKRNIVVAENLLKKIFEGTD